MTIRTPFNIAELKKHNNILYGLVMAHTVCRIQYTCVKRIRNLT